MPAAREPLVPILVDAAGRSGTTALMQLLASSPAVVTERGYPFESRYLTYLYAWSRLLDGDTEAASTWERRKMMPGPPDELGGLPWRELLPDPAGFASKCFLSAWRHFSEDAPAASTHYIEKVPRWIAEAAPAILPHTRVINLVRDPRDLWLSMAAFDRKRGFFAFGRKKDQGEGAFFADFVAAQHQRLGSLAGREFGEGEVLLRYEDMLADPAGIAARLGGWLGLDFDPAALDPRDEEHCTSGSQAESVGRWRMEMGKDWRKRFDAELGDLIGALGYA